MGRGEPVNALRRRSVLLATGAAALAACQRREPLAAQDRIATRWVGANAARGHRLRLTGTLPAPAKQHRTDVLVLGAGVAGLAAARAFMRQGRSDVQVLELEDQAGGNSRAHQLQGISCPLGAHYLPLPGAAAREVSELLFELGLLRTELGRTVADERHLCHSPQERLFIDGAWAEGLLPPADPQSSTAQQYRVFAAAVNRQRGFAMPAHRAVWSAEHETLNRTSFSQWLTAQGLTDEQLRWYLDYCCRDDYGASADGVSAWAGVHYFASRHGFHAPGDGTVEREPVFTWPEGNAWLTHRLAQSLGTRLQGGHTVLRVVQNKHQVEVLAWNESAQQAQVWLANTVVIALPLFIAAKVLQTPPQALLDATALLRYAPWLVANVHLKEPLLDREGAPPSWDNVIYRSQGLGYVDALHQTLRQQSGASGPTVITAYHALPAGARARLLDDDPTPWRDRVLQDLALAHPDITRRATHIDLVRWGHAMAIPAPGVHHHPALLALRQQRGPLRFAHADLAAYSVFEEAFIAGTEAAST
jgi:monoamine oxidase